MTGNYYELFEQYYRTTVGKFYTKEQCRRLLALLAGSNGMELDSEDFAAVSAAVDTVESYDVTGFVESKNFQLLCDMLEEAPAVITAATALTAVFEELSRVGTPHYASLVERTIALRTAVPKDNEVRLALAYLECALGDEEDTREELVALCDRNSFPALGHLAFLAHAAEDHEASLHYHLLLERVYVRELELEVAPWIARRLALAEGKLKKSRAAEIRERVKSLPAFLTSGESAPGSIGFNPTATARRFSYEH